MLYNGPQNPILVRKAPIFTTKAIQTLKPTALSPQATQKNPTNHPKPHSLHLYAQMVPVERVQILSLLLGKLEERGQKILAGLQGPEQSGNMLPSDNITPSNHVLQGLKLEASGSF